MHEDEVGRLDFIFTVFHREVVCSPERVGIVFHLQDGVAVSLIVLRLKVVNFLGEI